MMAVSVQKHQPSLVSESELAVKGKVLKERHPVVVTDLFDLYLRSQSPGLNPQKEFRVLIGIFCNPKLINPVRLNVSVVNLYFLNDLVLTRDLDAHVLRKQDIDRSALPGIFAQCMPDNLFQPPAGHPELIDCVFIGETDNKFRKR